MSLALSNFDAGLVQLAIQSGSVFSTARPVAPTYSLLLGMEPEMQENLISGAPNTPVYGALSDTEIRAGVIRSFFANNPGIGGDVARGSFGAGGTGMGAAVTPTQSEVLNDFAFKTTYYGDGGQTIGMHRMIEGTGGGWAAGQTYEQILATQMVEKYISDRSAALFATGASKMPDDGVFGSLRAMISDGLTSGTRPGGGGTTETDYVNYGGQNRASNANVRSQYLAKSGTFSEIIAQEAALTAYRNGAGKLIAPMSLGRFAKFEYDLRVAYGQYRIDEQIKTIVNGGQAIEAYGVIWYPEPALPANTTWQLLVDLGRPGMPNAVAKTAMQKSAIEHIKNPSVAGGDRLRWIFPDQCIIRNPKSCVLVEGLTAA
jgi:hypothetical protein